MALGQQVVIVLGLVLGSVLELAAQPRPGVQEAEGSWWGAIGWIAITLVFIAAAGVLLVKGLKHPNRR